MPAPSPDASFARLVLDSDVPEVPRLQLSWHPTGNFTASGSAQFSVAGWQELRATILQKQPAAFVVTDLRKESHGFINGAAISWYAAGSNWGCAGLSRTDVEELERLRLALVSNSPEVIVTTKTQVQLGAPGGDTWQVRQVCSEKRLIEDDGVQYVRLPVDDHCAPDAATLSALVELFESLPAGSHLHFHCRGGKGRTATALALLDIHQLAGLTPFAQIIERQAASTGYALDRQVDDTQQPKAPHLRARLETLRQFYADRAARRQC
jgi:protein-tyrosine phosphatase